MSCAVSLWRLVCSSISLFCASQRVACILSWAFIAFVSFCAWSIFCPIWATSPTSSLFFAVACSSFCLYLPARKRPRDRGAKGAEGDWGGARALLGLGRRALLVLELARLLLLDRRDAALRLLELHLDLAVLEAHLRRYSASDMLLKG